MITYYLLLFTSHFSRVPRHRRFRLEVRSKRLEVPPVRQRRTGGERGIRTPGRVITVAITLGRLSYAQRIEQRFLHLLRTPFSIGFLYFSLTNTISGALGCFSSAYHNEHVKTSSVPKNGMKNAPPADGGTGCLLIGTALFQTAPPTTTRR